MRSFGHFKGGQAERAVITFLIQAAGGGLSTSNDPRQAQTGGDIFLAGIAAQMASFALFSGMWILFIVRV